MIYRTDYHTHTKFSDGHGSPEEYIPFAVKENISELGFSDHLTLTNDQQDWSIKLDQLDRYVDDILALRDKTSGLQVKLGLEVDYFPDKEEELWKYIDKYPLDYVIGSVHYMDGPVDNGTEYYREKDIGSIFENYFALVGQAASSGLFDIIGHADLVRIYNFYPDTEIEALYKDLASVIKKNDLAIELNTNGMNKPLKDFYPNPVFLPVFAEEGVPVCVNSDSHFPSDVGQYFDQAYALLIRSGYKEMATFHQHKRSETRIAH